MFEQWWWTIPVIGAVVGFGIRTHYKFIEKQRGEAMLNEVDNYDSQEAVGDMPYNEKP